MSDSLIARCPLCHHEKLVLRHNGPWCFGGCSLNRQAELERECAAQGIEAPEPQEKIRVPRAPGEERAAGERGRPQPRDTGAKSGTRPASPTTRPAPAPRRDVDDFEDEHRVNPYDPTLPGMRGW